MALTVGVTNRCNVQKKAGPGDKMQVAKPSAAEIRLPMLWLSLLYGHIKASMAASHGIHSATEVVKCLLAGADVTMTTSASQPLFPAG